MRYRVLSVFFWLYGLMQPDFGLDVAVSYGIGFGLMAYKWTWIFPTILYVNAIALHLTDGMSYYVAWFFVLMSLFISIFTLPYGTVDPNAPEPTDPDGVC